MRSIKDLDILKKKGLDSLYPDKIKISVGMATCGIATGGQEVYEAIQAAVKQSGNKIILSKTGCLGFCQVEPVVDVWAPGMGRLTYKNMTPEKAGELVSLVARGGVKKEYLLCKFEEESMIGRIVKKYDTQRFSEDLDGVPTYGQVPFFSKQNRIVLRNCGFMDPDSIEEYVARDGYFALQRALTEFSGEQVIEEIKKSGLRGRGGAGFPTGVKWELCRKAEGETKYIICNADEGDPGAYMDRSVLEGDPHSVLEGMMIGAYAIGAEKGFVYVRSEYPLAIKRLREAIRQAKEHGLLGKDVLGCGFDFDIEIREGSGAFVCGEETSLIHSIEGEPPEPRQRPPFPAQSGLWGMPTNINNVETWANVPVIISRGADWFAGIGTEESKGTKVFSVVGKINNTGLVEVPMGTTLKEMIFDIGEGIPEGKSFKAVQTGGPSGGCVPAELVDLPLDYEKLKEAGSIMGSGGMVVMDEDTCVVDVAKFFLDFTMDESCGKCTSCRDGSQVLLEVFVRITEGDGKKSDIEFLQELSEAVKSASLCGLGQTLPNPVLSTLKYFRAEYEAHIDKKCCPAKVCRRLLCYYIDPARCAACGLCVKSCPVEAISGDKGVVYVIDQQKCTKCGLCFDVCPDRFRAVKKMSGESVPSAKSGVKVKTRVLE